MFLDINWLPRKYFLLSLTQHFNLSFMLSGSFEYPTIKFNHFPKKLDQIEHNALKIYFATESW